MTNQDQMWMPMRDDAIEIYVRYLMGQHGKSAHRYARKTADKLKGEGDLERYSAWSRVADAVERTAEKSNNVTPVPCKQYGRSGIAKADRT